MKKILLFIIAMVLAVPAVNAQNKILQKAIKKEYKSKMKEYKKEGWKLFGSSRSLDVALLKHYDKLETLGDNAYEIVGICAKYKSDNVGHQAAINNACNTYARNAGSHVKGRVVSDMASNGDDTSAEFDHFYAAYETLVEKEIRGEMQESYAIYKTLGNGEKTMQVYFIINEDAATKARIRAYENAMKESEAAQKYANKVSEFIKEGFEAQETEK
ncbi:MAG: hypothetical protein PUH57_01460 [Prevotellaceae bacterium]|nr:hypothetical protein [Prevotella sp.]MDD7246798.1 hypothetical protein [Prevotellaceae bacterium]MDY2750504.1 hypothetical protein [Prevotella sp.]